MSDTANVFTLTTPITTTFNGPDGKREETIAQLTVRPPLAGDLRVMDGAPGDVAKSIALMARLTGQDIRTIDKLSAADFAKLGEILTGFMPDGLQTGATS